MAELEQDLFSIINQDRGKDLVLPSLQERIEAQFGPLPEFHEERKNYQLRVVQYNPELGYVRLQSAREIAISTIRRSTHGTVVEYKLLDLLSKGKDRVSRHAHFDRTSRGIVSLLRSEVSYRQDHLEASYHVSYNFHNPDEPYDASVDIYYRHNPDAIDDSTRTSLISAKYFPSDPWAIRISHISLEELEEYYHHKKEPYMDNIYASIFPEQPPWVFLNFPDSGSDVIVRAVPKESPVKQIAEIRLGGSSTLVPVRGSYFYKARRENQEINVIRQGKNSYDSTTWELRLFDDNTDTKALGDAIKGDWTHLKTIKPAELKIK